MKESRKVYGWQVRAVALMRRVEARVQASMSYCINRAVSISSIDLLSQCLFKIVALLLFAHVLRHVLPLGSMKLYSCSR